MNGRVRRRRSWKLFFRRMIVILSLLLIFFTLVFIIKSVFESFKPYDLHTGWNKIDKINDKLPKGSIVLVTYDSDFRLPGDDEVDEPNGYVSSGVVVFLKDKHVLAENIYVYMPEEYSSVVMKIDNFILEANEKMMELTGSETDVTNLYFVGTP